MKGLLLACQVTGIRALKDKSVTINLTTQELSPASAGEIFRLQNLIVSCYLKETSVDQSEIDKVDKLDPEFGGKTQSQRLRNVLFKLYEQKNEGFQNFDLYYLHHTEIIINHLKNKIEQ